MGSARRRCRRGRFSPFSYGRDLSAPGLIAQAPESQQFATSLVEALLKVNKLKACQDPGEAVEITGLVEQRHDPVLEAVLLQCVGQLSLHPHRLHGAGRKNQQEPVTAPEGLADLIVPLLRCQDIRLAIPNWNPVTPQSLDEPGHEILILARVGEKYLVG